MGTRDWLGRLRCKVGISDGFFLVKPPRTKSKRNNSPDTTPKQKDENDSPEGGASSSSRNLPTGGSSSTSSSATAGNEAGLSKSPTSGTGGLSDDMDRGTYNSDPQKMQLDETGSLGSDEVMRFSQEKAINHSFSLAEQNMVSVQG